MYREYQGTPSRVPDEDVDLNYLSDSLITTDAIVPVVPDLGIFTNVTTLNFLHWFWNCGNLKSIADRDRLVNEVFHSSEGFHPEDICVRDLHAIDARLAGEGQSEQLVVGEG